MDRKLDVIAASRTDFDGVVVGKSSLDLLALYFALAKYDDDYGGESLAPQDA